MAYYYLLYLLSQVFLAHDFKHNLLVHFFGISFFFLLNLKKKKIYKTYFPISDIVLGSLNFKTHDDFHTIYLLQSTSQSIKLFLGWVIFIMVTTFYIYIFFKFNILSTFYKFFFISFQCYLFFNLF